MRILIINSRYFLSAGPEKYMFGLINILKSHGHEVIPFSVKNSRNVKTEYEKYFADPIGGEDKVYFKEYKKDLKTTSQIIGRQFYSSYVKKKLDVLIKGTKPDIAYILHHHNKLSPSVIDACKKNHLPVVMRLSDFFLVCPNIHLYRDHGICRECIDKSLFRAVKHRCVKNSFFGSLLKVSAMYFQRLIRIYKKVDYVISPSLFTKGIVKPYLGENKIIHIPTFVTRSEKYNSHFGNYCLIVGRIEENKGILTAIKAIEKTKYTLKVVGKSSTGYEKVLKEYITQNKITSVNLLGEKLGEGLRQIYVNSRFVIIPAEWYENMPNVALEAMIYSKPVISSEIGSLKELVKNGYNGLLFKPRNVNQLKEKVKLLFENDSLCKRMGRNSYNEAIEKYDPETHYKKLIRVFKRAIKEQK